MSRSNDCYCHEHENGGGRYGTNGKPRDAADAVAGGAAAPEPRTEADQQTGQYDDAPTPRHFRRWDFKPDQTGGKRRQDEPRDKSNAPALIIRFEVEAPAKYTADTCDPTGEQHQKCR